MQRQVVLNAVQGVVMGRWNFAVAGARADAIALAIGVCVAMFSGGAWAQEIVAFQKRVGEQRVMTQHVVYRDEGWRNLRLVYFESYLTPGRPLMPQAAYYVCGHRLLLVPTTTWQIENDEYTQYRGVSGGKPS